MPDRDDANARYGVYSNLIHWRMFMKHTRRFCRDWNVLLARTKPIVPANCKRAFHPFASGSSCVNANYFSFFFYCFFAFFFRFLFFVFRFANERERESYARRCSADCNLQVALVDLPFRLIGNVITSKRCQQRGRLAYTQVHARVFDIRVAALYSN